LNYQNIIHGFVHVRVVEVRIGHGELIVMSAVKKPLIIIKINNNEIS